MIPRWDATPPTGQPGRARATRAQAIGMGQGIDAETADTLTVRNWDRGTTTWRRALEAFASALTELLLLRRLPGASEMLRRLRAAPTRGPSSKPRRR